MRREEPPVRHQAFQWAACMQQDEFARLKRLTA